MPRCMKVLQRKSDMLAVTDIQTTGTHTMIRGSRARPRVELQLEEESRISVTGGGIASSAPGSAARNEAVGSRIFPQDDDPEFDDLEL
jgi:hypothetical protein